MFTLTAIKMLLERKIEVELLCIRDSRIHIEANNLGLIIHPVKAGGYFHPFTIIRTALLIKKCRYDLIHTQASKDLWILVPALKFTRIGIPLFLTKQIGSFLVKKDPLHRFLYRRVNRIFAISSMIKDNVLDTCPVHEKDVSLLHNGVNARRFSPDSVNRNQVREESGIKQDEIVIGMLARISPGKGHEEFIQAASVLNKKFSNLRFLIVGEASRGEDAYADSVRELALSSGLDENIFTGFRSDTERILSAMDIFVFPSHSEAFGIALVEAMAMEVPSVCARADGVLDIAVDGETSYFFERRNADDLRKKIELLISSPHERKRLGKNARKRVLENFDLNILTDKVITYYKGEINKS